MSGSSYTSIWWPKDLNAPVSKVWEDVALSYDHTGSGLEIPPFTEKERISILIFAANLDQKYRTSILDAHASNSNQREVMLEKYPKSFKVDSIYLYHAVESFFTSRYRSTEERRAFINQTAFRLQGFISGYTEDEAKSFYDTLFAEYDKAALRELIDYLSSMEPLKYAAPLLRQSITRKIMLMAFDMDTPENLDDVPLNWLYQMID